MTQDNLKQYEISEIKIQNELLKDCLQKFPELQDKTQKLQLKKIQNKYQFYLRKYQKITQQYNKYKQLYENIQKMILESPQIIQENRSIQFINKVMEQTQKNYIKLKKDVEKMKTQKQINQNKMIKLKNILLDMKAEYFELQRKEQALLQSIKKENVDNRSKKYEKTMFKIRQDKKYQQNQSKIRPFQMSKLSMEYSLCERTIITQLDAINTVKQQFLQSIGTNIKEYYKINERQLNIKDKNNKLILKKDFNIKQRKSLKKIQNYEPQNEVFEVDRILKEYQAQFNQFMQQNNQFILNIIVKKGKVNDMMQLIEEQKRGIIKGYRKTKNQRFKIN